MSGAILANIVNIIHKIIVLFIVGTPFFGGLPLLLINSVFIFGIMFHWALNSNICILTVIEKSLRGLPYDGQTFFGQLFGKIYAITENSQIYWIGMGILLTVTLFRIIFDARVKNEDRLM